MVAKIDGGGWWVVGGGIALELPTSGLQPIFNALRRHTVLRRAVGYHSLTPLHLLTMYLGRSIPMLSVAALDEDGGRRLVLCLEQLQQLGIITAVSIPYLYRARGALRRTGTG